MKKQYKVNNEFLEIYSFLLVTSKRTFNFVGVTEDIKIKDGLSEFKKLSIKTFPVETGNNICFGVNEDLTTKNPIKGFLFFTNYNRNLGVSHRIYESSTIYKKKKVINLLIYFFGKLKKSKVYFKNQTLVFKMDFLIRESRFVYGNINKFIEEKLK